MSISRREILVGVAIAGAACLTGPWSLGQGKEGGSTTQRRPRLYCRPGVLEQSVAMLESTKDTRATQLFEEAVLSFDEAATDLARRYGQDKPAFGFAERSSLIDLTVIAGLASRVSHVPSGRGQTMRRGVIDAAMRLVNALNRAGRKDRDYHVGQGSNMLPLAGVYDWMYDDLTVAERNAIVGALVAYSLVPTVEALFVGGEKGAKPFWVSGYNNWTTICLSGALGLGLALRPSDDPGEIKALTPSGEAVTRPFAEHWAIFLPGAIKNMQRGFRPIRDNKGLQPEGTGYHHDTVLPLYLTVASMESSFPAARPDFVTAFLREAKETASVHIFAGIHMCGPTGTDWQYADGTWPLTTLPINLLIAGYAKETSAPLAAAASWRALQLGGKSDRGLHLLFRSLSTPAPSFDPATIPTAHYFFDRLIDTDHAELTINECVVTWRQNFTDPKSAAVFFKGGDRRRDYHSHLDIGTFLYDALGVRWAIDIGRGEGYPYYFKDGGKDWKTVTTCQVYPKRAAAHNTLVLNAAVNDYTLRKVPEPRDWYWQFNPDQCLFAGKVPPVCLVEELETDPRSPIYRGTVNLYGAYQLHGVRSLAEGAPTDPCRRFTFDRASGMLTIRDELYFVRPAANDVHWFANIPTKAHVNSLTPNRKLLSIAREADGQMVHCLLDLKMAEGGDHRGLVHGKGGENIPPGQPADPIYWGYQNAKLHRETMQKVALRLEQVGRSATIEVAWIPQPNLTGLAPDAASRRFDG